MITATTYQSKFPLTDEQRAVVAAAVTERSPVLVVKARAGSGKTFALETIAQNTNRSGLYIVFNKRMQEEAEKRMPGNIVVRTMHSLAFQALNVKERFAAKLFQKIAYRDKYQALGIGRGLSYARTAYRTLQDIEATVRRFCQSADADIQACHLPKFPVTLFVPERSRLEVRRLTEKTDEQSRAKLEDILTKAEGEQSRYLAAVLDGARQYWTMAIDPQCLTIPIGHDHYLKLWGLSGPVLDYDFVMADEAQDFNAINLQIVNSQKCQQIFVGDAEQQIYSWRGSLDALGQVERTGKAKSLYLSRSFRFGQEIADTANALLYYKSSGLKQIKGFDGRDSRVGAVDHAKPYTIIARGNNEIFRTAMDIAADGWRKKLHVVGGLRDAVDLVESGYWLKVKMEAKRVDPALLRHDDVRKFDTWLELEDAAQDDRQLQRLVGMLDKYGEQIPVIVDDLKGHRSTPAKHADIVVTTTHKAKGLEWDQVVMAEDFPDVTSSEFSGDMAEELNVLYVAATRALDVLQVNRVVANCVKKFAHCESLDLVPVHSPVPVPVPVHEPVPISDIELEPPELPPPELLEPPELPLVRARSPAPVHLDRHGLPVYCGRNQRHRNFFRRQEEGARWYCTTCDLSGRGSYDSLPSSIETVTVPDGFGDDPENWTVGARVDNPAVGSGIGKK